MTGTHTGARARTPAGSRQCGLLVDGGRRCPNPAESGSPMSLCTNHLLEAYDRVAAEVGVVDLLPSACVACGSRVGVRYPSGWLCADCEWRVGDVPDDELSRPLVEVVYYLRYRDQVKIGTSANPRLRFAAIPHDEVLAFERGGRRLEHRRHLQFAEHRFPGTEWFAARPVVVAHIDELREGVEDPWVQYDRWVSRQAALRG